MDELWDWFNTENIQIVEDDDIEELTATEDDDLDLLDDDVDNEEDENVDDKDHDLDEDDEEKPLSNLLDLTSFSSGGNVPVSYTHLDVYKRQQYECEDDGRSYDLVWSYLDSVCIHRWSTKKCYR